VLQRWPLVGREEELRFAARALQDSLSVGAVIAGPAGVGKTRMIHEALEAAEADGSEVSFAQATAGARSIPLGTLAHLLPADLAGPGPKNLLRAAADALSVRWHSDQAILAVDDAHLIDATSATLVHLLAQTRRCRLLVAVRTGEAVPDPISALWKEELATRLELQPLSRIESDELVDAFLGSLVDAGTLQRLWDVSRGNVLFLREVVLGGLDSGALTRSDGIWRWRGSVGAFPRLMEVIEARLRDVPVRQRSVLELVAAGEPLEAHILDALAAERDLVALERRGLLEWQIGDQELVRLTHPLYAEALRSRLTPRRARTIYRTLARTLEASHGDGPEDLLRLGTWYLDAGDRTRGDLLVAAARNAITRFDYPLAERLARAALGSSEGVDPELELAEALIGQGAWQEAEDLLAHVDSSDLTTADNGAVAIVRSSNMFWHLGRGEEASSLLRAAETETLDPVLRSELGATRVAFLVFGGQTEEAIRLGKGVLEDPSASDRAVLQAASMVSWTLNVVGRPRESRELAGRFLELARRRAEDVPFADEWLSSNAAFIFSGDLRDVENRIQERHRRAVERGAEPVRAGYEFGLGMTCRVRGKVRSAAEWLRQGVALMRDYDPFNNLSATLGELAHAFALAGDAARAEAALTEAEAVRVASFRMDEGHIGLARAWIAAAYGESSKALDLALRTADTVGSMGQLTYEAAALHDVARLGKPAEVAGRLRRLCDVTDADLIRAFSAHANVLARSDPAGLLEASKRFEALGADLYAGEAAAEASRSFHREGRKGSALAARERARTLADRCEGARTPALRAIEEDLPLTVREREISTLAARGLSNQEIARRLVISVRTVENHLHSAYSKLGIGGREELAEILRPVSVSEPDPLPIPR
jgi:DNA-binding NarL/FixJ family response regulator